MIKTAKAQTLGELIHNEQDSELLKMYSEIQESKLPADGYIRSFCRRCNKLVDKGELCVNRMTFRKVYAPTVVRLVEQELAYRYSIRFSLEDLYGNKTEY